MNLTPQQVEELAESAARRAIQTAFAPDVIAEAVRQTLIQLGVDAENPLEMQRDFQHLRQWRKAEAELKSKGLIALVGILVSGFAALLLLGLRSWIKGQ